MLTHRATTGESSQRTKNGEAIQAAFGLNAATAIPVAIAIPTPPAICRWNAARLRFRLAFA